MVNITYVDLFALATSFSLNYHLEALANASTSQVSFISYNDDFARTILGPNTSQKLVADLSWQAFHEAGVYNIATGKLYIASNWNGSIANPNNITAVDLHTDDVQSLRYPNLITANGGTAFYPVGTPANSSKGQQIVFCDNGDMVQPAQLTLIDPVANTSRVLLNNFFGRNFSSPNDIKQHAHTGDLWFTDAPYGYWQHFRPPPTIRPQVYRFEPKTGVVQAVADGFIAPNGFEFSPDFKYAYVTDSGAGTFSNEYNFTGPATIYRYEVTEDGKRLHDRQVFAYSDNGIPDGIHTDTDGNVFAGCGDGIHVWNPEGVLLGKIVVANGVNNFAFVPGGLYIFNGYKLFKATLGSQGREVKRDFGLS